MNCRYDNSMYTTIPPEIIIEPENTEEEFFEEMVREHNFEESYEKQHLEFMLNFDDAVMQELIRHEPHCKSVRRKLSWGSHP